MRGFYFRVNTSTPKALANLSPGLECSEQPWGLIKKKRRIFLINGDPRVPASLEPWAAVGQRLQRFKPRNLDYRLTRFRLRVFRSWPRCREDRWFD